MMTIFFIDEVSLSCGYNVPDPYEWLIAKSKPTTLPIRNH
jgi:hypothetical protein